MKKIISERRGLFETNSSSSHSLSLNVDVFNSKTKYFTDYEKEHYIKNNKYYLNFEDALKAGDNVGYLYNTFNDKVIILLIKLLKHDIYFSNFNKGKDDILESNKEKTFTEHLLLEDKISNQGLLNLYHNLYLDQKILSADTVIIRYFKMIKRLLKAKTGLELVIPKNLTIKISEALLSSMYEIYKSLDEVICFIYKNYNDFEEGIKDFLLDCGFAIKIYESGSIEDSLGNMLDDKKKCYSKDENIDDSLLYYLLGLKSNNYSLDSVYQDSEAFTSNELEYCIKYLEDPEYAKYIDEKIKNFTDAVEKYANNVYIDINVLMAYLEFKNARKEEELKNEKNGEI